MQILTKITVIAAIAMSCSACASTFMKASYNLLDKDKDQFISKAEFENEFVADAEYRNEARDAGMTPEEYAAKHFSQADSNDDDKLSYEEYNYWVRNS